MAANSKKILRRSVAVTLSVLTICAIVLAYIYRQDIIDTFEANRFQPTPRVTEIYEQLQLTEAGSRVFLASHPTVDGTQNFNEQCENVDHINEGHILGCFTDSQIHLFDVQDDRLTGIVEVTAAHELLHAAFARLSENEKNTLADQLSVLYSDLVINDPALAERMSVYSELSETAFANELHSVLGTEQSKLPQWLNEHYSRWFTDRQIIVSMYDDYHVVFLEITQRAQQLDSELRDLRADIEQRNLNYQASVDLFNTDWAGFIARNNAFGFTTDPDEFYRVRDSFETRRAELNQIFQVLNTDIERYEKMRLELADIGELNTELLGNLDSSLAPPSLPLASQ